VLSYLNAQDKMLYVEYGFKPIEQYPAKLATPVSLETLLRLHGYKPNDNLGYEAKHVDIAKVIMEICQSDEGIAEWRTWLGNELQHTQLPKNYGLLQPFVEVLEEKTEKRPSENAEETTEVITSWRVWLRNQLQNNQLPPKWESFIEMIEEEIEKRSSENAKQTIYWNDKKLISYSKWFIGGWLEDYVFNTIQSLAAPCALHDYRISLKPVSLVGHNTRGNFELDIVAVQNYQLFGISCIASKKENGEVKKHLLEVYVRARQLGGDEARVALVYLGDNPQAVQYEIDRTWLPSNALRVFGRRDLPDLRNCLYRWFK
jgi:hypothetical protein